VKWRYTFSTCPPAAEASISPYMGKNIRKRLDVREHLSLKPSELVWRRCSCSDISLAMLKMIPSSSAFIQNPAAMYYPSLRINEKECNLQHLILVVVVAKVKCSELFIID
jgi:hypothetical protein